MLMLAVLFVLIQSMSATSVPVYFPSNSSNLQISSSTLDLQTLTSFSFRTCSTSGLILSQTGTSGDYFHVYLTPVGGLTFDSRGGASVSSVNLGRGFNDNNWYVFRMESSLGNITASVSSGSVSLGSAVLATGTLRRYLWNINLSGGPMIVGNGFVGCLIEGPGVPISSFTANNGVQMNQCPLENQISCPNLDIVNDCWSAPCKFGGTCIDRFRSFTCKCLPSYNGTTCETYIGSNPISGPNAYSGRNCQTKINYCGSSPCKNRGICSDQPSNYTCSCAGTVVVFG
ncbi:protein crumbs-like [Tubulanus polymorphus]|uniref:protein crumbs-like n=1 Tax=Tubulanus polymorphus TaxID=672921 RepID=UPI003DA256D8